MSEASRTRAAIMMMHAYKRVSDGHTSTSGKLKRFFTHKVTQQLRNTSAAEYVAIGVGVTVSAGVLIASAVLTAGIAPAILAGIAAGTYVLKKLITSIGNEVTRYNRNWLNNYKKAVSASTLNWGDALGTEAKDGIRRAVDHYNITRSIINTELRARSQEEFTTCHEAINRALAVSRFVHHSDKTRNYLLPCIDFCIFMLTNYKSMSDKWNAKYQSLEKALEQWFDYHETILIGHCNRDSSEICYGAPSRGSTQFRKAHPSSGGTGSFTVSTATNSVKIDGKSIDLTDVIRALMEGSVNSIEKVMLRNNSKIKATYNFHSIKPSTTLQRDWAKQTEGALVRFTQLVNDAFARANNPGYLSKVGRKVSHSVTRRTKGEVAASLFAEAVDLSSIATPFIPNLEIGEVLGAMIKGGSLIRGGITATTTATELFNGWASMKNAEGTAIRSGLLNFQTAKEITDTRVKSAGAKVEELIVKTGTHFHNAFNACKAIEELGGYEIGDCRQAWEYCKAIAEVIHEFGKMERYLMMTLSLVAFLGNETVVWSEAEAEVWVDMEKTVATWVADPLAHQACRDAGGNCYGHKVTSVVRGGTLSSFFHGRYDEVIDYTKPHKPL